MLYQRRRPLILASTSPRRRSLMRDLGLEVTCLAPGFEECRQPGESVPDYVARNALGKAGAGLKQTGAAAPGQGAVVVGADTVVVCQDVLMEKPGGPEEAAEMLQRLSGREHEVWSAFALVASEGPLGVHHCRSVVTMRTLTAPLIAAYVATGESLDKAGAYGIQGYGAFLVRSVQGSYSNVVGLPLAELTEALEEAGVIAPAAGSPL